MLVISPYALISRSVVQCRPVGMLQMTDESGADGKIIAVPHDKMYEDIKVVMDVPKFLLEQLAHFFEHYKDLEKDKWVKIDGWVDVDEAKNEIMASVMRFNNSPISQ